MKIHRVVQMLGATTSTGKLAKDMYDLGHKDYYSEAQGTYIPISHMDFQHMVRAFVKLCEQEEMLDRSKHMNTTKDLRVMCNGKDEIIKSLHEKIKKLQDDLKGGFKQSVDDLDRLEAQENKLLELTTKVENLQGMLKERDELLEQAESLAHRESKHVEYWRKLYYNCESTKGHYYTFTEVPQDEEGKEFVKNCRKYLNKESYKIRVKGQHLKKELYGQGRAYHGANMEDCSHMRVYIDKKRGDE